MILIVDYFMHVPITFYLHDGSSGSYSDATFYELVLTMRWHLARSYSYRYSNYVKKKFKP